ncbi:MAG TPA: hypothetical protein VJA21_13775 [Verrucomicrobiae bacterium]
MNALIDQKFGGNTAALARVVGATRRTVNDWAAGELRPSLGSLLGLEYCFGANAIDWITRNILIPDLPLARALERIVIDRIRAAPRHHSAEKVRAALTAAMEAKEYPPPSLRAVCLRLGYHQTVASRKCPELAESIMARFRSFQTESKRTREYFMRQTLESAVNQLLWEGRSLSFHQLAKVLPPHISIRDKRVLQEFKRLRKEAEDELQAVMQEPVVPAPTTKAQL